MHLHKIQENKNIHADWLSIKLAAYTSMFASYQESIKCSANAFLVKDENNFCIECLRDFFNKHDESIVISGTVTQISFEKIDELLTKGLIIISWQDSNSLINRTYVLWDIIQEYFGEEPDIFYIYEADNNTFFDIDSIINFVIIIMKGNKGIVLGYLCFI